MSPLTHFLLSITFCLGISAGMILVIKAKLRNVLIETCGTEARADFWLTFTQLMVLIAPLMIVIFFSPTTEIIETDAITHLKNALFQTLFGLFTALAVTGKVIWRSISEGNSGSLPALSNRED